MKHTILTLLLLPMLACAGSTMTKKTTPTAPPEPTVVQPEVGLFTDIVPENALKGQRLVIKYFKLVWVPIGEGELLDISGTKEEIKGSGSMAGKSASVYWLVEDRGENRARFKFEITGEANESVDEEAGYTKDPGALIVKTEQTKVTQTRYEKSCDFLGCGGPGIEIFIQSVDGKEDRLRFEFVE